MSMTTIESAAIDADANRDAEIRHLTDGELDAASGGYWVGLAFVAIGIGAAVYAACHD